MTAKTALASHRAVKTTADDIYTTKRIVALKVKIKVWTLVIAPIT